MSSDPPPYRDDDNSESLNDSAAERETRKPRSRADQFERLYRAEFGHVVAYFARRTLDPRAVASLTMETFVAAIQALETLDPERVSPRAWMIGMARRVYRRHRESDPRTSVDPGLLVEQLLGHDEAEELMWRIDVEASSRHLVERLERMSVLDREAVELVDLCGLDPTEAARELGMSTGALRVRLVRARARLKRESADDV